MNPSQAIHCLKTAYPKSNPSPFEDVSMPGVDSELRARMGAAIKDSDHRRYGMSLDAFCKLVHDDEAQAKFEEKFGISFEEYAVRFLEQESMGEAMRDGKFSPLPAIE